MSRTTTEAVGGSSPSGASTLRFSRGSLIGLALVAIGLTAFFDSAAGPGLAAQPAAAASAPAVLSARGEEEARAAYGRLPLAFVPNAGQTDARVRYSAHAGGASFYFTKKDAVLALTKGKKRTVLRLAFLGANPAARIEGHRQGKGRVNYLLGSDPRRWRTGLPTYGEIVYRDLWPGVDMRFRGAGGRLKYEFLLRPGARPADIRLAYRGAARLSVSGTGNLLVSTPIGVVRDERPRSYQEIGNRRLPVSSRFALERGRHVYGFALGAYDPRRPLVVDPGLLYSTYLGGGESDIGHGIDVDAAGSAYLIGWTYSPDFPNTSGAFDATRKGSSAVFVTKLSPSGAALLYSTYLGGSGDEGGLGITVDAAGSAYLTGSTDSADFPTTPGAFDATRNGVGDDVFATRLSASGASLLYSTYLGGSSGEYAHRIVVDGAGSAYLTGSTDSADFPTTSGALDTTRSGSSDAFATKLSASGSTLLYSTYVGGGSGEGGLGIAVDAAGSAYLTGSTGSADFPTTSGALDTTRNGVGDAFVAKLSASGAALLYSTYLGGSSGSSTDVAYGIRVDAAGSAYVTGSTGSADFPTTPGAFDTTRSGVDDDAFVTKLSPSGATLLYSTYLGGTGGEYAHGISVDAGGSAYVTGSTDSADFPTTSGAFATSRSGVGNDAFVTKLSPGGAALLYSTYLGGSSGEGGLGVAVDAVGSAYVTGSTDSADFPTTTGTFDTTANGSYDVFVTKLNAAAAQPGTLTCSQATAGLSAGAPTVFGIDPSEAQWVLWRTNFWRSDGSSLELSSAQYLLSYATATIAAETWWDLSGNPVGTTATIAQTTDPAPGYWFATQEVYWFDSSGNLVHGEHLLVTTVTGPNAVAGTALCAF